MNIMRYTKNQNGVIAIIMIILVTSITVVYGLSAALMTADEISASQAWLYTSRAHSMTSTCFDNALATLLNNSAATGNVNISVGNVNCIATIRGTGNWRSIVANATSSDAFGRSVVDRATTTVNINTNPFTITRYKDILE